MAYCWPAGTAFTRMDVAVEDRACPVCACSMHVCDHRSHHLWTLQGPTQVVNRLGRCPEPSCASRGRPFSPAADLSISMPRWGLGWEGLCWLGHRRFARHWSGPQLRAACKDTDQIRLSDAAITHALGLSHTRLAARQQAPARLAEAYRESASLVLTSDGGQPDKGQETWSGVRERTRKRVWCAEPVLSRAEQEGHRGIVRARQWAQRWGKPVRAWMSDKQEAFVKAIATECPGIPPRDGHNHVVRAVAKPVLAMDRPAQVTMRSTGRGVRASERRVWAERRPAVAPQSPPPPAPPKSAAPPNAAAPASATPAQAATPESCVASAGGLGQPASALEATGVAPAEDPEVEDEAGEVVRSDGAAVRGMLNESPGGPLPPPGVRLSAALQEVHDSRAHTLGAKKGGRPSPW